MIMTYSFIPLSCYCFFTLNSSLVKGFININPKFCQKLAKEIWYLGNFQFVLVLISLHTVMFDNQMSILKIGIAVEFLTR